MEEYPNYMGFLEIDFNDSETLRRELDFQANEDGYFMDAANHTYKSYGTYYPKIILRNNVSQVEMKFRIEVDQCVNNFEIGLTSSRYSQLKHNTLKNLALLFLIRNYQ